jgi:flagellar motor switch protein FliN/FliY
MTNSSQPHDHEVNDGTPPVVPAHGTEAPDAPSTDKTEVTPERDPSHNDIDLLLQQAEEAIASVDRSASSSEDGATPFQLREFSGSPATTENATVDLLRDVELDLRIELGRTHLHLEEVLKLRKGSVVTLDRLAGDPVDVYVNGRLVARGEVLVLNDNFCVRVAELVAGDAA